MCSLQQFLYSFEIKALALSDYFFSGTPFTFLYSRRNAITVSWFVFLQIFAIGQRLFLSTATKINGEEFMCLLFKFPVKSIWISPPGFFGGSIFEFSVLGSWVFQMFWLSFQYRLACLVTRRLSHRSTFCYFLGG